MADTVHALLHGHAPDRPAIGAPDRPWLTYGALADQAGRVREAINRLGIGRGDRVALVLPNGPEMAAAFVCLAGCVEVAPLNPAFPYDEVAFSLQELCVRLLVVSAADDGPAVAAARALGIPVARLETQADGPAGTVPLIAGEGASPGTPACPGVAHPDEGALVLQTSGTTARPKVVPLLNRNVAASARHIGATLALTPDDRCLNIMPLFHIHGLIAAVTASLAHGASVWCAPGFDALRVFGWLREARPTWVTAVPTMHQAILARAARNAETLAAVKLRFIRSSSASLPVPVMTALEKTFACPVIESYGMTEACHQMTSNPLPPASRRAGSVGLAAGPLVRLAEETAPRLLNADPGRPGEVVISGPNVTPGYENNPDANAKAFFEAEGRRWFRTGDQGVMDAEGMLTLTGRLKELINRGGEKISPLEVDGVLMAHPAVHQVVTFAIPHRTLGEDVGAAVVLREGHTASDHDLRAFAAERLAAFKVPRTVLIVGEIPKGPTGKLRRIGLAETLGVAAR